MGRIVQFFKEVRAELAKVIWPSRRETVRMTLVVLAFSIGVAAFLGAIDYGLTRLVRFAIER